MPPVSSEQAAAHKLRVSSILNRTGWTIREKTLGIWNYILSVEAAHGTTWLITKPDGNLYVVLGLAQQIMPLPRAGRGGERFFAYLNHVYGLAETEKITSFLYATIRAFCINHGQQVALRRFAAFNRDTRTIYLSAYDGTMWKIEGSDPDQITRIRNGEDDIFFVDDDGGVPCPEPQIAPHGILFDRLTDLNFIDGVSGMLSPYHQRLALMIWLIAIALPDAMPTKPVMLLEGTQGSGKSLSLQLIQYALMGEAKPIVLDKNQASDFGVLLLRSPIAVLDNLDAYYDWLPDKIAAYTTFGIFPKRKLYSDDEEVMIRPHAFVAVASKNPASFRREDVADRCIIIRLDRRKSFTPSSELVPAILAERPRLLGEYLFTLGRVIDEMRAMDADPSIISTGETLRMADFARIGRVVQRVMGWPENTIDELTAALAGERDAFINEEDPLCDLLSKWISYRQRTGGTNIGRHVTIHVLHAELESLAQANQVTTYYKSPRHLAQKIRSPHVLREFDVEVCTDGGRKTYQIWRKTDPHLSVIDGGSASTPQIDPPLSIVGIEEDPTKTSNEP